jgi:hypothetical protein
MNLHMFFGLVLLTVGCVVPVTSYRESGELLRETGDVKKTVSPRVEVTYSYPDIRITYTERVRKTWTERLGTREQEGLYHYSLYGDLQELIVAGPLFVSGLYGIGRDTLLLDYQPQTFSNMLYILTILPAFQHSDVASKSKDTVLTGRIDWGQWKSSKTDAYLSQPKRTLNFVSEDDVVIYQAETNSDGEAFEDVRKIFGRLFNGRQQPIKVVELVSRTSSRLPINLRKSNVRWAARKVREEKQLNEELSPTDEE